ncbi:MAG TPA: hypothetical protein VLA24_02980 [Pseudomonadales bacterium]|nr:hypothetical protein [Pseudomonadales bacterium]
MHNRNLPLKTMLAGGFMLASMGAAAATSVFHFSFSNDQLVFEKQTGGRNCEANNPMSRDTCALQGEGAYMLQYVVNGPDNGCALIGMETQGQAASLDYEEGNFVAAVSASDKNLTIRNQNSQKEDIVYEIVYTCNGVEKRWHPTLKNRPWD